MKKYTEKDFKRDIFFVLGYFQAGVIDDKRINKERVKQFTIYCYNHFGDKKKYRE